MKAISNKGWINSNRENELIDDLMKRLHVRTTGREQEVKSLSGGNQQKW